MPSGIHEVELDMPIINIWTFICDMNQWAPLVPGYIGHEIIDDKQSKLMFKADIGILQKNITLRIDITEWKKPTKISFNISERTGNFSGGGHFTAEVLSDNKTKVTGHLQVIANGMMGPMMNKIMKSFIQKNTIELIEAIAQGITDLKSIRS